MRLACACAGATGVFHRGEGRCRVVEGFAVGFGWLELLALSVLLAYFLLRQPR